MNSSEPIFTEATVVISEREYRKLLEYKNLCKELHSILKGDAEC